MRPDGSRVGVKMLSDIEVQKLLNAAKKHSALGHALVSTAYNGAFRVCELTHLKVSDFDFSFNKVSVIPAKKARLIGKDLPAAIDYPMPENSMRCVESWIHDQKLSHGDWLFRGNVRCCQVVKYPCPGNHLSTREAQRIFDEILLKVGIKVPGRGIHVLKHARLTELAGKTHDPWFVKAAGRHESISMSDVYVHYSDLSNRIRAIGSIL